MSQGQPLSALRSRRRVVCFQVNYARLRNGDSSPGSKAGDDVSRHRRSDCRMETFERWIHRRRTAHARSAVEDPRHPRAARPLRRTDAGGVRADAGRDSNPRRVAPDGVAACQARRTRRRACPPREEKRPANQGDRRPGHVVWTLLMSQGQPLSALRSRRRVVCFQVNYARLRNGDSSPGSKAGDDVSRHRRSDCRMETFERWMHCRRTAHARSAVEHARHPALIARFVEQTPAAYVAMQAARLESSACRPDGVAACQARRTRRRAYPSQEEKRPANQGDRRPSHAVWTLAISQGAV